MDLPQLLLDQINITTRSISQNISTDQSIAAAGVITMTSKCSGGYKDMNGECVQVLNPDYTATYGLPSDRVTGIDATLAERGKRYGKFTDHAEYSQYLQSIMRSSPNWGEMSADQREALTIIAHKIARMLSGDPNYRDNWHDVVGYAKLVDDRMQKEGL